jgi:hypothetical protein
MDPIILEDVNDFLFICFTAILNTELVIPFQVVCKGFAITGRYFWDSYACSDGESDAGSGFGSMLCSISTHDITVIKEGVFFKSTAVFHYETQDNTVYLIDLCMTLVSLNIEVDTFRRGTHLVVGQQIQAQVKFSRTTGYEFHALELSQEPLVDETQHKILWEAKETQIAMLRAARLRDFQKNRCPIVCVGYCQGHTCGKSWPHSVHACDRCSPCRQVCQIDGCPGFCGRKKPMHTHHRCDAHSDRQHHRHRDRRKRR